MPELASFHNQLEYSVSEVSVAIKRVVEDAFGHVRLRGEISGYKGAHASGHCYFTLKDDKAAISAVMWRGSFSKLAFKPEDGLEVVAVGKVTTYPGRSNYQIVVDYMEPAGVGALMALLEKRKAQLAAEGLFAESRKKALPFMPRVIGVITSPTGAVIRDILHRLSDRFPCHVLVWPVAVQGEGAAAQVAEAIEGFNRLPLSFSSENGIGCGLGLTQPAGFASIPRPDILIVARGGGSIEDLWAFNEEIVVRAAANSTIVLISAVGHETDTTLIDYASDKRAPTPTAAAEMAVPILSEWRYTIQEYGTRLSRAMQQALAKRAEALEARTRHLVRLMQRIDQATQRLDDWSERLLMALPNLLRMRTEKLARFRLVPHNLLRGVDRHQDDIAKWDERLQNAYMQFLKDKTHKIVESTRMLENLNYERILARGFVMVTSGDQVITLAANVQSEAELILHFKDGTRMAKAI